MVQGARSAAGKSGAIPRRLTGRGRRLRAYGTYLDLLDAAETIRNDLRGQLALFGLTIEGFRLLEMLYRDGRTTVSAICARRRCRRTSLLGMTQRLEDRGWLRYEVAGLAPVEIRTTKIARHRRGRPSRGKQVATLRLTAAGEKFMDKVFPRHTKLVFAFLRALDSREQVMLSKLCRKVSIGDPVKMLHEISMEDVE